MKKPRLFYRRRFLNGRGYQTSAHAILMVRPVVENYDDGPHRSVNTTFRIADCTRSIDLDFFASGDKDLRGDYINAMCKAKLLKELVDDWFEAYMKALDWIWEGRDH